VDSFENKNFKNKTKNIFDKFTITEQKLINNMSTDEFNVLHKYNCLYLNNKIIQPIKEKKYHSNKILDEIWENINIIEEHLKCKVDDFTLEEIDKY
jgi:hypothetical protein